LLDRALGYANTGDSYQNALLLANHEIFIGASSIYSGFGDYNEGNNENARGGN
jgi:hypothetical protein